MKTIITTLALGASLLSIAASGLAADSPADKAETKATPKTVFVHPKFKGAVGASWVKVKATPAPTSVAASKCQLPRLISLKGALGGYVPGQQIMNCKASDECGTLGCTGHAACVHAG